jgi:hypothetical protein
MRPEPGTFKAAGLLAVCLLSQACATGRTVHCRQHEQPAIMDSLFFGTAKPDGQVGSEEWRRFVEEVITPRFPAGLTSWEAAGQWRNAAGTIEREQSHVLHILHPGAPRDEQALAEIIATYKKTFSQEAVLRVRNETCISF